jgi:hypothetical protein
MREDGTGRTICTSSRQRIIRGFKVSEGVERKLCFSRVQLTGECLLLPPLFNRHNAEDSGSATKAYDIDAVGTIKVEIDFCEVAAGKMRPREKFTKPAVTLSERTKKGGGHCTALGSERRSSVEPRTLIDQIIGLFHAEPVQVTYYTTFPCPDRPKYTFTFRHASKGISTSKSFIHEYSPGARLASS